MACKYTLGTQTTDGSLDYDRAGKASTNKAPLMAAMRLLAAKAFDSDAVAYCVICLGDTWHDDKVIAERRVA